MIEVLLTGCLFSILVRPMRFERSTCCGPCYAASLHA
jgi:hypothetical protein